MEALQILPFPLWGLVLLWVLDLLSYSAAYNSNVKRPIYQSDNQPFDCTTFSWAVLTMHGNEFSQGIPPTLTFYVAQVP